MTKPILFNTEMVRAILAGNKTVTRRVVKIKNPHEAESVKIGKSVQPGTAPELICYNSAGRPTAVYTAPYCPGDILYVRETWAQVDESIGMGLKKKKIIYRANYSDIEAKGWKWRPSIHMPKAAARIFLRVTGVRVERLQEMTEDDVVAEGAEPLIQCPNEHPVWDSDGVMYGMCWNEDPCSGCCDFINKSYGELFGEIVWDSTIKPADRDKYGWAANPFCWVIEFERCEKPEEEK